MAKIRIEFDEVASYPQLNTIRLWIDGKEISDGLKKGTMIKIWAHTLINL